MASEPPLWYTRHSGGVEWVYVGGRQWLNAANLNFQQRRARAVDEQRRYEAAQRESQHTAAAWWHQDKHFVDAWNAQKAEPSLATRREGQKAEPSLAPPPTPQPAKPTPAEPTFKVDLEPDNDAPALCS